MYDHRDSHTYSPPSRCFSHTSHTYVILSIQAFAHPQFLRDEPELCKQIKSGFVSTAAKLKALPQTVRGRVTQSNNNIGFKTPTSSSLALASRATVPVLPGNVYHRPVLQVKEDAVRRARNALALPLVQAQPQAHGSAAASASHIMNRPTSSSNPLEQELLIQNRYASLLRHQSNLQRRSVHTTFHLGGGASIGTTGRPASSHNDGNIFLPHGAVMAATRAVTAGAMDAIRRDMSSFGQASQDALSTSVQSPEAAHAATKLAHLKEREMILRNALTMALNGEQIEYGNRAA